MEFEWDPRKAAENLRKHGTTFDLASEVLDDPFVVEIVDDREDYGEERITAIGMVRGKVLRITYTLRGEHVRIISARKATRHEREDYYLQNGS